jgi:hypothetical protein
MPVAANQGTAKIVNRNDILPSPFRKAALRYHGLTALETQRAPKSLAKEGDSRWMPGWRALDLMKAALLEQAFTWMMHSNHFGKVREVISASSVPD